MPKLTDEQQSVYDAVLAFLADPAPARPYFLFEGLAGTGKTVLLAALAHAIPKCIPCTFTGKAASNLSRKMGMRALTIHSAIYAFMGEDDEGELIFDPKIEEGRWQRKIALVDEHSMVDTRLAEDLLRTGCRVIACGDPGQLPPVRGETHFHTPDAMLHTVHRQAWDSAIIRQAHSIRNTGTYRPDEEDFRVERFVQREDILAADIILCWRNNTRCALNRLKRAHLGLDGSPARAGEPLMCLRNDHKRALLNGATYPLLYDRRPWDPVVVMNERGYEIEVEGRIEDHEPPSNERDVLPFAYAYCATVHKYQGSEADFVILADEYTPAEWRREWLYTGVTRAAKRVLVQCVS